MRRLQTLLTLAALTFCGPTYTALAGINLWSGTGPLATGLGNRSINAIAISPDGRTIYAGTGSGTVFQYSYIPTYLLTVSIPPAGNGVGGGAVSGGIVSILCNSGNFGACTATLLEGTPVTLKATTAPDTTFNGWSGDCGGVGQCNMTMTRDMNVQAQFGLGPNGTGPRAKISNTGYNSVNDAYSAAGFTEMIMAVSGLHPNSSLTMDRANNITLKGGYDPQFSQATGLPTILQGKLTIKSGSLRVDGVRVRP